MALSSNDRRTTIDGHEINVRNYEAHLAKGFRPTVVIDCAFLTRDRILQTGLDSYIEINRDLIDRAESLAGLETVRKFIAISSGAAKPYFDLKNDRYMDDPYGALKADYERLLTGNSREVATKVVVCRPYSLSGRFARSRSSYALFNIIDQAKATESVFLESTKHVFRRYTDAEEFLALSLASSPGGPPLESGGELIELGTLAEKVISELNLSCTIRRQPISGLPDSYHSENSSFELACAQVGFTPSSLSEQIRTSSLSQ
jgi:nucleoside-diphosphate-sugar epimerase